MTSGDTVRKRLDVDTALKQISADVTRLIAFHNDKGRTRNRDYDHTPITMIRLLTKGHLRASAYDSGNNTSGPSDPTPAQATTQAPWNLPYHAEAEYRDNIRLAAEHLAAAMEVALKTRPIDPRTDTLRDDECCRQHLEWLGKKVVRGKKRGDLCYFCFDNKPLTYEQLAYYETYGKMPGKRVNPNPTRHGH